MTNRIFFLELLATYNAHWDKARKGFSKLGLSDGIPKVLYILLHQEGCTQKKLAELCQIKESTLTVMLKRLEVLGYIKKEAIHSTAGKRAFGIFLTESGRKKAKEIEQFVASLDEGSLKGFQPEEMELLYHLLDRMKKNLEEMEE